MKQTNLTETQQQLKKILIPVIREIINENLNFSDIALRGISKDYGIDFYIVKQIMKKSTTKNEFFDNLDKYQDTLDYTD